MMYKQSFPDAEQARDYAIRMTETGASFEFDLTKKELDDVQDGHSLVLVVGHGHPTATAIVVTRRAFYTKPGDDKETAAEKAIPGL